MLDKRRHKKLTESVPIDQQLIALRKEEMELKREMLKKMDYQKQQFNQTMKILQENTTKIYRYRFWCITNDGSITAAKQRYVPIKK